MKNTPLPDAEFEVRDANNQPVGERVNSDKDGYVTANGLAPGKYKFVETKAPEGYLINQTEIPFTIAKEAAGKPAVVEALDGEDFIDYKGSAKLIKTNADGTKLADAVFNILDASGNPVIKSITSNADGEIVANELAPGKYTFVEMKAPAGYLINTDPVAFEIPADAKGEPNQVKANKGKNFINYQGSAKLLKTNEKGKKLPDALFDLKTSEGKVITKDLRTNTEGEITVDHLAPGDYQFVETKAPPGYIINTESVKFTIKDVAKDQPKVIIASESFINYQGKVVLTKVDADNTGKHLANAEFQLLDSHQTVLRKNLKTEGDGQLKVTNLAPGKYYFKETKAPDGYQVSDKLIEFTIVSKNNGKPTQIDVVAKNKELPNTPNKPNQPSKPGQEYYPKTGESKGMKLLIIGVLVILLVIGITYIRRNRNRR